MSKTTFIGDLVATTETYNDKDGKERRKFLKVGAVFSTDTENGKRLSVKMDAMPLSAEWNRWLSVYPRKNWRADEESKYDRQQTAGSYDKNDVTDLGESIDLSDIPF